MNKRLFLKCFVLVCLVGGCSYQLSFAQLPEKVESTKPSSQLLSKECEQSLRKAQTLMDEGQYHFAIDELHRALTLENHSDIHWFIGKAYLGLERRKLAYYSLLRANKGHSDNIDVLASLADLVLEFGTVSQAKSLLAPIKSKLPEVFDTYKWQVLLMKADKAYKECRFVRAFHSYEKVSASMPLFSKRADAGCIESLKSLALVYRKVDKPKKQLKVLFRLYQINSTKKVADLISDLFDKLGKPSLFQRQVSSILSHSKTL